MTNPDEVLPVPVKRIPLTRSERNRRHYLKADGAKKRERYRLFRVYIDAYKVEHGCVDCGYNSHPAALDFDHRDRSLKIASVATMFTYTDAHLLEEIEKCDVRCSNCHRIKTFEQKHTGKQGLADWGKGGLD